MTKRYTGGVISSSLPTVNAAGASGVFLLSQQADYQSRNSWPPFKVEESLRFRSSASGYLNRTPASAGNRKTWTWSGWVKRGTLGVSQYFFSGGTGGGDTTQFGINFLADNKLNWLGGSGTQYRTTTQVFRDPAAWYHIVLAFDTTLATANDRIKIYVNGTQITAFDNLTNPTQNVDYGVNQAEAHNIGRWTGASGYFDGYMSEVYFVDGQALTPSSFGATDKDGNWSPIAYTGTYGTNGFYVNFRDNTSATTMGYDYSGNGNNWTLNGFNVSTANTTYDIMIDVPEDQSDGTANNRGNYCTMNPLMEFGSNLTWTNGNLRVSKASASTTDYTYGTIGVSSGKWYWEMTITAFAGTSPTMYFGVARGLNVTAAYDETAIWYASDGTKTNRASASYNQAYGSSYTTNDVLAVALDLDAGTITFYKNNVSQGVAYSNLGSYPGLYMAYVGFDGASNSATTEWNFGQRPFAYAPPSGFKALNTFNLPEPTIKQPNKQFDVNLWTGNGTSQNIVNNGSMQPDWVWVKQRNGTYRHQLVDAIRGVTRSLFSSDGDAEATYQGVTAFNSNGFSVGTELGTNENGSTFVGWQWNAGNANTTNTSGTITSIVRANPTAGFSIVTYTGNATSGATVGHGLGVAPSMVILKSRSLGTNWYVYHSGLTSALYQVYLNLTSAQDDTGFTALNDKAPTSTVFELPGTGYGSNNSGATYVAYCFAPVAGYSAFSTYVGNGSTDGPFIHTGFRPKFVITKRTDSSSGGNWTIIDGARNPYNVTNLRMYADTNDADGAGNIVHDFVSNGFKVRQGDSSTNNISGATYIYMAFAEMPFKYARAR